MIKRKSWKEFRESGLLWLVNMILHTFGWSIVVESNEEGIITEAYPARVMFRGFSEENNDKGYQQISQYMDQNSGEIMKEAFTIYGIDLSSQPDK